MEVKIYYCLWDREDGPESHELLRRAVENYLHGVPEGFTVCGGEHGKPYVRELPAVHFSIAHNGEFWACAVGACESGLDLQKTRMPYTDRIAQRFFHPSETAWLKGRGGDAFFRVWTAKESYVKFTGKGLSEGLDYFSVIDGVPACQQEIPFRNGYRMTLTTAREVDARLEELPAAAGERTAG